MSNSYVNSVNLVNLNYSQDGLILDVNAGDLGSADTSFTYFLLGAAGFDGFSLQYDIVATTLTIEASNDDFSYADEADELVVNTNDRTFGGAGNWEADGSGASIAVNAGVLDVTVGAANTGAKLDKAYMVATGSAPVDSYRGFKRGKRFTVLLTIASVSAGTVSVYAGNQLIASGLTNGAAQSFNFLMKEFGEKLSVVGTDAAATFSLDNISIKRQAANWDDITPIIADDVSVTSITTSGSAEFMSGISKARVRIKRVTTNSTNGLELRLARRKI